MTYALEVRVLIERQGRAEIYEWQEMRPSGGKPYRWPTRNEAEKMAYVTYGNDPESVRIVEIFGE